MTKPAISLLLLALLTGCATRTWTEVTETTRPVGPSTIEIHNRGIDDAYFDARTPMEEDGYQYVDTLNTDAQGEIEINLLPAALQCLYYEHDVTLELWSYETNNVVWTKTIDVEFSRTIIEEWAVQAKLGADVPLKRKTSELLNKLMGTTRSSEVLDSLETIKPQVSVRFD